MKVHLSQPKELPAKSFISTAYEFEKPLSKSVFYAPQSVKLAKPIKKLLIDNVSVFNQKNVQDIVTSKKPISEKIIELFLLHDILTGDGTYIKNSKKNLEKQLNSFIAAKKPIIFSLLQLPFKAPNPLKTERTLPDLGEIAYLYQLHLLAQAVKQIYVPGAIFMILGESLVFKDIADISMGEALTFRRALYWWIKKLEFDKTIHLLELRELEKKIPGFYEILKKEELSLSKKYYQKDKKALDAVDAALPTLFLTLNVRDLPQETLLHVFDKKNKKLTIEEKEIRTELERNVTEVALRYLPYHMAVKKTKMREILWPHSIGVSPIAKPNRFGVFPLNKYNKLYPMHGVAVYTKDGYVVTRYKIDVLRDPAVKYAYKVSYGQFEAIEKQEKDPFFYSEVKL